MDSCENRAGKTITFTNNCQTSPHTISDQNSILLTGESMPIEIIEYRPAFAKAFKELNLSWIEKYFRVEEPDIEALSKPEKYIIESGGSIYFALEGEQVVGTCALVRKDQTTFELAKMAVQESHQGKHIGEKLGRAVIAKAKAQGATAVILETNKILTPAVRLYEKLGFVPAQRPSDDPPSRYERSNLYMRLDL